MSSGEARRRRLALAAAAHTGLAARVTMGAQQPVTCTSSQSSATTRTSTISVASVTAACMDTTTASLASRTASPPMLCATPPWVARASASMQQGRHHCTRSLLESRRRSVALLASPIASRRRCNATPPHRLHGRHRLHGGGSEGTGLELLRVCQDVGRALGRACVLARWPPRRLGPEEGAGRACMHGGVRRSAAK